MRLEPQGVTGTTSYYTAPGDLSISVRGGIHALECTYHEPGFFRNADALLCPPATSNRTTGVAVVWAP